jgi:hypothetical protein
MRLIRFVLLFAWLLLLSGCSRRDAELREQITGIWTQDDSEMTLAANGSFISHMADSTNSWTFQGTWKVRNGSLVTTITNIVATTGTFEGIGSVERYGIFRADRTDLVFSNAVQMISYKRKK